MTEITATRNEDFYADAEVWDHEFCEPDAECCGYSADEEYEGRHRDEQ